MQPFYIHNHTQYSNLRLRDSIIKENLLIDEAIQLGLPGLAITDHESLASHVKALKYMDKLKKEGKDNGFKLALGNEIYLVDKEETLRLKEEKERIPFYHFILVAKNKTGYQAIRKLSSMAAENSFMYKGMQRVPSFKHQFEEVIKPQKGNIIGSTACLGGEFGRLVLQYIQTSDKEDRKKIIDFLNYMIDIFGRDNFYIELQPSFGQDQIDVNTMALKIAKHMNIKVTITTDTHYLRPEHKKIHSIYLKAKDGDRETEDFYASTYLMNKEELYEYFSNYIERKEFEEIINNSLEIMEGIEEFSLARQTQIPKAHMEVDLRYADMFGGVTGYKYIDKFQNSKELTDRQLLALIGKGLDEKGLAWNEVHMERINKELRTLWKVSESLGQPMSSYYVLTTDIVNLMWLESFVGIARGSVTGFFICYLTGITQMNPLEWKLPDWRHLDELRPDFPDIDIDSESSKREAILNRVKEKYGEKNVINVGTFRQEAPKAAIQTICRALDIPIDEARYLSSLVPTEKMKVYTIHECMDLMNSRYDCKKLIDEMNKYENLLESVLMIEGLVCGSGVHAAGVVVSNESYYDNIPVMRAANGLLVTQYDLKDTEYMGGLKLDFLSISALDRIRKCFDLLLQYNKIEWQGSLRKTYDKYLHPSVLEYNSPEMWNLLYSGEVINAFQFETVVGGAALRKVNPHSLQEVIAANSLMRLSCEGKQPIDKFVEHKHNIELWYQEMNEYNLTEEEKQIFKDHLEVTYGVADTQESVMQLSMDNRICGFDTILANKLRKSIAKKDPELQKEIKGVIFEHGKNINTSDNVLNYFWDMCIVPQLGYSFSLNHTTPYSAILLQELNLVFRYGSLYWKTACLSVNAGILNEEDLAAADYGAIAKAIGNMKNFVLPPYINDAGIGFIPMEKENKVLYSLAAINGIGADIVNTIIENRPYNSFEDFLKKCIDTKLIGNAKGYNLIKSGCFDKMGDRKVLMKKYVEHITPLKTKLTTANIPKLVEYNLIPSELKKEMLLFSFRKEVFKKANVSEMINKTQGLYRIPENMRNYFDTHLMMDFVDALSYDDTGAPVLYSKIFDNVYKKLMEPLTNWLSSEEAIELYNTYLLREQWKKYCLGNIYSWEIETIGFYTGTHEAALIPTDVYFTKSFFNQLNDQPKVLSERKWGGKMIPTYETHLIVGTVVDKNKNKNLVVLNTEDGIVEVKLSKDKFVHYDKVVEDDESWFKRGTKLVVHGYRKENLFIPKVYKNSVYKHPIMRISKYNDKNVYFKLDKKEVLY